MPLLQPLCDWGSFRSDSVAWVQVLFDRWRPGSATRRRGLSSVALLVGACSYFRVERGTDNPLQETMAACAPHLSTMASAMKVMPACMLCRLFLSWGRSRDLIRPTWAAVNLRAFQHGQSRFAVCRVTRSPSCALAWFHLESCFAQGRCQAIPALAEPAWLSFPHREVISVGQNRCLVLM